jgi:hypothetical protein
MHALWQRRANGWQGAVGSPACAEPNRRESFLMQMAILLVLALMLVRPRRKLGGGHRFGVPGE